MTIRLVTGVPGAGKSLYAVAKIVKPLVGTSMSDEHGRSFNRRLCIGGIRDLLLEHEPVEIATFDPEGGRCGPHPLETRERKPGEPPIECERRADNWWLWCMPGDFIVIDECQRLFRPMAAGRKLPMFVAMLETHRHYGVDFLLITQHPMLLHASVRNLVGQHGHVRRMFGGAQTVIYEWDHCSNPDRIKNATKHVWRHDKKAYELYKSAEIHTKSKHGLPLAVFVLAGAVVVMPALGYTLYGRMNERFGGAAGAASAPSQASSGASVGATKERTPTSTTIASAAASPASAASMPSASASAVEASFAGCIKFKARCECIDTDGKSRTVTLEFCEGAVTRGGTSLPYPVGGAAPSRVVDSKVTGQRTPS